MKLICEINLPDDADEDLIQAVITTAGKTRSMWKTRFSRELRAQRTNLENKCGGCKFFVPNQHGLKSYGSCDAGGAWGVRTRKACKKYERREDI
jgi:hypothetical protein